MLVGQERLSGNFCLSESLENRPLSLYSYILRSGLLRWRQTLYYPLAGLSAGSDIRDLLNCLGFNCLGLIADI